MKLMYFSDKKHLVYARTIFFDGYYKLERVPVASLTLNIINNIKDKFWISLTCNIGAENKENVS